MAASSFKNSTSSFKYDIALYSFKSSSIFKDSSGTTNTILLSSISLIHSFAFCISSFLDHIKSIITPSALKSFRIFSAFLYAVICSTSIKLLLKYLVTL